VRIQPTESDTSNRKDYFAPKNAQSDQMHLVYKPDAMVGARQRLMMQKLQASARVTTQAPVAPREWETMHSTMYTQPIVEENYKETLGAKRMRNQDNAPIKGRDQTFLLEAGIVAPHICLEAPDAKEAAQDSALGAQGVPVTVYSDNPSAFYMSNPAQGAYPLSSLFWAEIPLQLVALWACKTVMCPLLLLRPQPVR
jgi:hypothetical protein